MLTDDERLAIHHAANLIQMHYGDDVPVLGDLATKLRAIAAPRVATVGELLATAPVERRLCEQDIIVLRPNRTYIFTVDPSCAKCVELARVADPSTRGPIGEG